MEGLDSQLFKEIYEVINLANITQDRNLLRTKIIEVLFNRIYVENSVFFLPNKKKKSTGGIEINIDEKYVKQYKAYYHRYDPIQRIRGSLCKKRVIQLEELIDYRSFMASKFYCEFLRPQKIHYKLYLNLYAGDRFHGRIALYRPVKSERFSKEDVHVLKTISPYLSHALDHNDLYINIKLQNNILQIIDNNWSTGLILLTDSMQLIYMNQKAKDVCQCLTGYPVIQDLYSRIPQVLLKDCHGIMEELRRCPADCLILPKYRVVRINNSEKFCVSSQVIEKEISSANCRLLLISIEEMNESKRIDQHRLNKVYHLTNREMDIVRHICKGLRNAEIAQKLFISEITVKKHIQHIFQKMGVKNRTALIHRILDKEYFFSD